MTQPPQSTSLPSPDDFLHDQDSFWSAIDSLVDTLPDSDLVTLNRKVVSRINLIRELKLLREKAGFIKGDKVKFTCQHGTTHFGTVIRKNQKSISVRSDDDHTSWNVSPRLLTKINHA